MAGWEFGAAHREYLGARTVDLRVNYRRGTGAQGAMPAPEEAFGEGTARPRILTADVQFNTPLEIAQQALRYSGSWRAQWNRSPLVPQDRFSIGESVLSAERGWLIRNDLAMPWRDTGQELYIGVDHGEVGGASSSQLAGKSMTGAVVGMRGAWKWIHYDVFAGGALHKPDALSASGVVSGFTVGAAY
jgi:hemolysin activation/secretion protein